MKKRTGALLIGFLIFQFVAGCSSSQPSATDNQGTETTKSEQAKTQEMVLNWNAEGGERRRQTRAWHQTGLPLT
ncbi:oligopeptide ABC transporter substrate-binding protein [Brevibacillus agri]|uniref:hypothetical protein n=1 Tax=Brevibacillus TaxID=55080 RepID=UPI0002716EB3|nr:MULTISPECIES: hypothetical protein [Brevibacillus]ELK39491.1 oligopeptide ABC transporter substrate-binding protein [Brevibacillus agri BAB-2500]EJL39465.1 hypothetical protein PMI08_04977 [Brevibacillus sp. CF112]MBG9565818.1 oligopeptide ABC transporter substrate-binding protein [Brevibacillus agri]MCG5254492.1 oligopeptide ABC transporter substrate-binding protein [Brevibacillus agri]MDN4092308.1 oligopeptide ABC transporter substrate-binding protein [Brevibacillus agri]